MKTNPSIEQTISAAVAATPLTVVSRDEVRNWIVEAQCRSRKRIQQISFTFALAFLIVVAGIGFSMNQQVHLIRQLVEKNPTKAVTNLKEVTLEVCQAPPADYFIQQLSNHKPIHRSVSLVAR